MKKALAVILLLGFILSVTGCTKGEEQVSLAGSLDYMSFDTIRQAEFSNPFHTVLFATSPIPEWEPETFKSETDRNALAKLYNVLVAAEDTLSDGYRPDQHKLYYSGYELPSLGIVFCIDENLGDETVSKKIVVDWITDTGKLIIQVEGSPELYCEKYISEESAKVLEELFYEFA